MLCTIVAADCFIFAVGSLTSRSPSWSLFGIALFCGVCFLTFGFQFNYLGGIMFAVLSALSALYILLFYFAALWVDASFIAKLILAPALFIDLLVIILAAATIIASPMQRWGTGAQMTPVGLYSFIITVLIVYLNLDITARLSGLAPSLLACALQTAIIKTALALCSDLKADIILDSLRALFRRFDIPTIVQVVRHGLRFFRVLASTGLVLLFATSLLSSHLHVSGIPHLLAFVTSLSIFLVIIGEMFSLPRATHAGLFLYQRLHLYLWDILRLALSKTLHILAQTVSRARPVIFALFLKMNALVRIGLPLIHRLMNGVIVLVWNTASVAMLSAFAVLALAFLVRTICPHS